MHKYLRPEAFDPALSHFARTAMRCIMHCKPRGKPALVSSQGLIQGQGGAQKGGVLKPEDISFLQRWREGSVERGLQPSSPWELARRFGLLCLHLRQIRPENSHQLVSGHIAAALCAVASSWVLPACCEQFLASRMTKYYFHNIDKPGDQVCANRTSARKRS